MKFCSKCGNSLEDNETVCKACSTPVISNQPQTVVTNHPKVSALGIVALILSIIGFCTGFIGIGILFDIIAIILSIISLIFSRKKDYKNGLPVAAIILSGISIILMFVMYSMSTPTDKKDHLSVKDRACTEAVEVFHKNVRLKNEKSFQLNGYEVTTDENYHDDKNLTRYIIKVKYSAQNGLGGYSSDAYTVELLYDSAADNFSTLSSHQ